MARPIKQKNVGPSLDVPWGSAIQVKNSSGVAISANDIVYASGRSGSHLVVTKADADLPIRAIGTLYVANHDIANGDYGFALPWKIVTGVNTSASSAAGAPVYLSGTAGGWSITAPVTAAAGTAATKIRIGTVLEDHATTGAVLLAPGATDASAGGYGLAIADPGTNDSYIPVTNSGTCAITTTGSTLARKLAIPTFAGQQIAISLDVDGGTLVLTCDEDFNTGGHDAWTAADAGDTSVYIGVQVGGVLRWRQILNDGGTNG
jgi:hypothetical protein